MNFTREPIIETIISPKEGFKLLVRNSKGESCEEYYVDSVEVVSFGHAFFFRSTERPKAFLVPVGDYEVVEVKEARLPLKNVSYEKNIKIGGGREAPIRPQREHKETAEESTEESPAEETTPLDTAVHSRMDRKRDRRHRRKRRGGYEERETEANKQQVHHEAEKKGGEVPEAEPKAVPVFSTMIPPPPTLISETLSRYREKEAAESKEREEEKKEKPQEEDPGSSSSSVLQRVVTQEANFNANYFIPFGEVATTFSSSDKRSYPLREIAS